MAKTQATLLELPAIAKFYKTLKSTKEQEDFKKHMLKYISIWLCDCPFEVSTTNRYTLTDYDASATARRRILSGETIKYLCGNLVAMTPEEEEELDLNRRDFSVVRAVRKKTTSLFLGPARFANHDCNPNARLCQQGEEGMTIIARRDINVGDEITVDYGDHYFGNNNKECLCVTCEKKGRNGWAPKETKPANKGTPLSEGSRTVTPSSKRLRSQRTCENQTKSPRSLKPFKPSVKRDAPSGLYTPPASKNSTSSGVDSTDNAVESSDDEFRFSANRKTLRRGFHGQKIAYHPSPFSKLNMQARKESRDQTQTSYVNYWLGRPTHESKPKPHTSVWMMPSPSASDSGAASKSVHCPGDSISVEELRGKSIFQTRDTTPAVESKPLKTNGRATLNQKKSSLSLSRARESTPPDTGEDTEDKDSSEDDLEEEAPESESGDSSEKIPRKPGDYTRTRALLVVRQARWVDCPTCDIPWVETQEQTRAECSRCERHSKLYGFRWPKTEPKGENDQRVLDHRLISRTLKYHEEKALPRRGHGLDKPITQPEIKELIESSSDEEDDGARKFRRTRARAVVNVKKRPIEEVEPDPRVLERKNKNLRSAKNWIMLT